MVAGGLAGASPHMISATVTALSRLVFEFRGEFSSSIDESQTLNVPPDRQYLYFDACGVVLHTTRVCLFCKSRDRQIRARIHQARRAHTSSGPPASSPQGSRSCPSAMVARSQQSLQGAGAEHIRAHDPALRMGRCLCVLR